MPTPNYVREVTVGGITADILIEGYRKGINANGPWRDILYGVDWDKSDSFMEKLMGSAGASAGPGSLIKFPVKHQYPGNENLYCMEVTADPFGIIKPSMEVLNELGYPDARRSKLLDADKAKVFAHYESSTIDFGGVFGETSFGGTAAPWSQDNIRGYVQKYPIPAGVLKAKPDDEPNDKAFEVPVNHQEYTRRRFMYNYLFTDLLESLGGTVNEYPIFGKPKGTMYLQPYDASADTQTDGSRSISLTMSWLRRPYDWNAKISKTPPYRWVIQWDGTNYPIPYADHRPLLDI